MARSEDGTTDPLPCVMQACYAEMVRLALYLRARFPDAVQATESHTTVDTVIALLDRASPEEHG